MPKTHRSALVVIPPEDRWEPIQAIRRRHDRHLRRWMPHITLLYPFVPIDELDVTMAALRRGCVGVRPFNVRLDEFRTFPHGRDRFTLWLDPSPREKLTDLQRSLQTLFPHCDDVARFSTGYLPHLSVGQAVGRRTAMQIVEELGAAWVPLVFELKHVSLIYRFGEDPFKTLEVVPLGGGGEAD